MLKAMRKTGKLLDSSGDAAKSLQRLGEMLFHWLALPFRIVSPDPIEDAGVKRNGSVHGHLCAILLVRTQAKFNHDG